MKQFLLLFVATSALIVACKKNKDGNGGSGNTATVTFQNSRSFPQRLIITGTGASDTVFPFPNKILDIDVPANTSVTRTDIPEGTRKLYSAIVCTAGTPVNILCTTIVSRKVVFAKGNSYTESF